MKRKGAKLQRRKRLKSETLGMRRDHEVVSFGGRLIPILGTVGGSKAESEETARNIEAFLKSA